MKATLSGIKNNHREPTVKGRKPRFKSKIWNIKIKIQPEQNEETRIQKK